MQTRYSKQREEIYTVLKNTKLHPTAEWVYEQVRKNDPTVSLGTVYRNLAMLCEQGRAIIVETSDKKTHYDGCVEDHAHFVCNECGGVFDVDGYCDRSAVIKSGFTVERTSLVYYGLCPECLKEKGKSSV